MVNDMGCKTSGECTEASDEILKVITCVPKNEETSDQAIQRHPAIMSIKAFTLAESA